MSLNEKALMSTEIFGFFKNKKSTCVNIKSFVIDKPFVAWYVLEECCPEAVVLLGQFRVIIDWKNGW
ncbi:hypothetical protein PHMEG_0003237 [Phytophthora megakarya]|uniref:Uncharacterized protein n=1 Tax=Phytophthora megakarya TaxID=4795 RepID=A0A225WYG7_9STRA|nr:hypothetical protein PHMEG_0003237 [Phytophthora megakarya]